MDGRRGDLFDRIDTSSRSEQMDLLDYGCKRKAAALVSPEPERGRPPHKKHQKPYASPSLDLGAMLNGTGISHHSYRKIQGVLFDQDKEVQRLTRGLHDRDDDIRDRGEHAAALARRIGGLERENERIREEKSRAAASSNTLKQLREKNASLQKVIKEKDEYLALGTQAVQDKTKMVQRLEEENGRLRQTITERDAMVTKLNEQLWKVTSAPGDERTKELLQAQATITLSTVTGLKADVHCRDERIKDLLDQFKGLNSQVEQMNGVIRGGNLTKADLQREVEGVKRELKKESDRADRGMERAQEARRVADQQQDLIKRLLDENKRLSAEDEE